MKTGKIIAISAIILGITATAAAADTTRTDNRSYWGTHSTSNMNPNDRVSPTNNRYNLTDGTAYANTFRNDGSGTYLPNGNSSRTGDVVSDYSNNGGFFRR